MIGQSRMRLLLSLLLAAAFISSPIFSEVQGQSQIDSQGSTQSPDLSSKIAVIEKIIEDKRKEQGVPGVAVVIIKDDKVVLQKGFGLRDVDRNLPVTPETLFAIGSCTKAFTAMAAVISADEYKLSLDDSPKRYLPYFKMQDPEADAKITIRDLLHHSSGLDRTDITWYTGVLTREEVIRVAGLARPTARFREKFQYQNVMYSAAGEVVAKAEKSIWEKIIAKRFFKPLRMKSTNTSVKDMQKTGDFASGYSLSEKIATKVPTRDLLNIAPAGAINSNVRDMAQWIRLMLGSGVFEGKRFVSEKGFEEITRKQIAMGASGYGLGWSLYQWNGQKLLSHGGGIDGFTSLVALIPEEKIGLVILTNVSGSSLPQSVQDAIFTNLIDKPKKIVAEASSSEPPGAPKTDSAATSNSGQYKELIAKYELNGTTVEIKAHNSKTALVIPGQPAFTLIKKENDIFTAAELPENYRLLVKRDNNGKVAGILIKQPEKEFEFKRIPEAADPKISLTIDDLMAKAIVAAGGETNLRKHRSMVVTSVLEFENQGITGDFTSFAQAPNAAATNIALMALGKKIGTVRSYFDGVKGGEEMSFSPAEELKGKQLEDARIASDFYWQLNWKTLFKEVKIKELTKIGGEEVYVVVKTPEKGNVITDYISAKNFLIIRHDSFINVGGEQITLPVSETYSDFRTVDGVTMPFQSLTRHPSMGQIVTRVNEVKFDVVIPETTFKK